MKKCLFIIDVQKGFLSDKTEYVIPRISSLLDKNIFDIVLATKFINETGSPYRKFMNWDRLSDDDETEVNEIVKTHSQYIMEKNVYTAVNDFTKKLIKENDLQCIFILGIDTDCCVLKTAVDLFELGIKPVVLSYYSASNGGKPSQKAALTVLKRFIGKSIIESEINEQIVNDITC